MRELASFAGGGGERRSRRARKAVDYSYASYDRDMAEADAPSPRRSSRTTDVAWRRNSGVDGDDSDERVRRSFVE